NRGFKRAHVLVGRAGRGGVGDLGRAVAAAHAGGTIAGTPAYMSPEQKRGEPVDGRSDQYSFCLTFANALVGRRPLSAAELRCAIPRWLRQIVFRGLDEEPAKRHPSMDALLDEVERRRPDRRARGVAAAAAAAI